MKKMVQLKRNLLLLVCFFVAGIATTFAQTVVPVAEGFNTLADAVVANPGATLVLARGGNYVVDHEVLINSATIIKGASTPAATAPAVISYYADPGAASGHHLFNIAANLTLHNVGLQGFTFDDQQIGELLNITTHGVTLVMDSCVFQGANEVFETNAYNHMTITQTNNIFFNLVTVGWDNYGGYNGIWAGDTLTFNCVNNTFFMCARVLDAAYSGPTALNWIEHNTFANIWGDTWYPTQSEGFVVKNNILYNPQIRGYVGKRVWLSNVGDTIDKYNGDFSGDFTGDTLQGDINIYPQHIDSIGGSRNVVVTNNLRYTNAAVLAKQKEATASMEPFINDSTLRVFAKYPHWTLKDNLIEGAGTMDPQFQTTIPDSAYYLSFKQLIERRRASLQGVGYPYSTGWWPKGATLGQFIWPLPFNFKPTNQSLPKGSDGYPLGDLNWWGTKVVNDWNAQNPYVGVAKREIAGLSLTSFPNPVSSSTTISFAIPNEALVSLKVYNAIGTEVASLVNSSMSAGSHSVNFDVSSFTNGIYLYKLQFGNNSLVQKMIVMK